MHYFILTFIGDDQPGFVQSIAEVISDWEGNWLESRMSQLEGKFAGLARIGVSVENTEPLKLALYNLSENKFTLSIEDVNESVTGELQKYQLSILGHDRPGIVHEVTRTLAKHHINVMEMSSNIIAAAMTGIPLQGHHELSLPRTHSRRVARARSISVLTPASPSSRSTAISRRGSSSRYRSRSASRVRVFRCSRQWRRASR